MFSKGGIASSHPDPTSKHALFIHFHHTMNLGKVPQPSTERLAQNREEFSSWLGCGLPLCPRAFPSGQVASRSAWIPLRTERVRPGLRPGAFRFRCRFASWLYPDLWLPFVPYSLGSEFHFFPLNLCHSHLLVTASISLINPGLGYPPQEER